MEFFQVHKGTVNFVVNIKLYESFIKMLAH